MMKQKVLILTLLACALLPWWGCAPKGNVVGRVTCDGKGVKGVVVSDGYEVVTTDARGKYSMNSAKQNGYVFISVPSGYEVERNGLIPRHFVRLEGSGLETADFSLRKVDNTDYTLFVFTDVHLTGDEVDKDLPQMRATFLPDICHEIRSAKGPVYGLCLGDMSTDAKWYKNDFALPEYLGVVGSMDIPVFHTVGNHDNDPKVEGDTRDWMVHSKDRYHREIGPNYYSFNLGDVHYIVLDDIVVYGPQPKDGSERYDYNPGEAFNYYVDSVQVAWMKKDLQYVSKDKPLVVAMHVPMYALRPGKGENADLPHADLAVSWYGGEPAPESNQLCPYTPHMNAEEILEVLKDFKTVHLLAGHRHTSENMVINEHVFSHILASVSAVSWKLNDVPYPITCDDGTPGGYQIFSVGGEDIRWIFKANDAPVEKSQCRLYDLNKEPVAYGGQPGGDVLLLNVFNWDPEWTVKILEEGEELPVTQVWSKDPLYTKIRTESMMLRHRPTAFLPASSWHIFRAVRKSPDSKVEAVVMDRFGNAFTAIPVE